MRAIHINPWAKTITEIDLDADDDGITYEALRAAVFPAPRRPGYIEAFGIGGGVTAYVDEEGLLMPWEEQRFFNLHPPGRTSAEGRDLAGHCVLTGDDGWGNSVDLPHHITLDMVRASVTWVDAREVVVEAPKVYTEDPETGEVTKVSDQGQWTYDRQPT